MDVAVLLWPLCCHELSKQLLTKHWVINWLAWFSAWTFVNNSHNSPTVALKINSFCYLTFLHFFKQWFWFRKKTYFLKTIYCNCVELSILKIHRAFAHFNLRSYLLWFFFHLKVHIENFASCFSLKLIGTWTYQLFETYHCTIIWLLFTVFQHHFLTLGYQSTGKRRSLEEGFNTSKETNGNQPDYSKPLVQSGEVSDNRNR